MSDEGSRNLRHERQGEANESVGSHGDTYTHGHAEPVLRSHETRTVENSLAYGMALLRPGMDVLDLGCGPGTITTGIARLVAPGRVIAADLDPGVLERARGHALAQGITNIDFRVMDAYDLDLGADSVDFAHAHQVLQHVSDPVAVLTEMRRVTKPGGTIAVRDADYSGFVWYPADAQLDRWLSLYIQAARSNGGEPDAGRRLLAWARRAGLADVVSTSSTWTYPAGEGARSWGTMWADRVLGSALTTQLLEQGLATLDELRTISQAWRFWSEDPDAWFIVPSGELLATVP